MSVEPGVDHPRPAVTTARPARPTGRHPHPYAGPIALLSAGCALLLANLVLASLPTISVPVWLAAVSILVAVTAIIAPIIAGRIGGSRA